MIRLDNEIIHANDGGVIVSMNLSKGHREVIVCFHGSYVNEGSKESGKNWGWGGGCRESVWVRAVVERGEIDGSGKLEGMKRKRERGSF